MLTFHRRRGRHSERVDVVWNGERAATSNLHVHATPRGRSCVKATTPDGRLCTFVSDADAARLLEAGVEDDLSGGAEAGDGGD